MTAAPTLGSQRRTASFSAAQAQGGAAEQRRADLLAAQEFQRIARFAAGCRRQWPGARIVLRPDCAPERPAIFWRAGCAHADEAGDVPVQSGAAGANKEEEPTKQTDLNEVADETEQSTRKDLSMGLDPFREMAAALRSRTGFDGTMLKFSKGRWTAGKDAIGMNDREMNAHVDQLMYGWTKWEDKKPVDYHVGFVRDRYKPPKRRDLGNNDSDKWERPDQDPWQLTFFLPLTDPNNGELFVYSTTSRGGKDALANLQDAYADNRELHPEAAPKLPVICLTSDHYQHPDYGRVETPALDIVRWIDSPKNIKQVRPPAAAMTTLALEHAKNDEAADKESDSDFGDFEDEIPF